MEIKDRLITWISLALVRRDVERIDRFRPLHARVTPDASLEKTGDID